MTIKLQKFIANNTDGYVDYNVYMHPYNFQSARNYEDTYGFYYYGFVSCLFSQYTPMMNASTKYSSWTSLIGNINSEMIMLAPGISTTEPTVDDYYVAEEDEEFGGLTFVTSVSKRGTSTIPPRFTTIWINNTDSAITVNCQYLVSSCYAAYNGMKITLPLLLDHTKFDKPKVIEPSQYLFLTAQAGETLEY